MKASIDSRTSVYITKTFPSFVMNHRPELKARDFAKKSINFAAMRVFKNLDLAFDISLIFRVAHSKEENTTA